MNSAELTAALSQKLQLSKTEVSKRMEDTIAIITAELSKNNQVSLGSLGALEVTKRNERISVNPSTGKKMLVPPKLVVKFKTSNSLKDKLKGMKP
ncbi:MAG: HU family DNA-binding protein [Candidatus Symbiothrix sp.]|jgi:nucleoid DNA-binding protein|nr:HU family DNA-binding protein [Candidatus Symbiothrix sp.]